MNSVGNFFSTVTKFYNEINPATLSGAIDIIVVQQANGDLACSPFHVRFGKLSVLRPQEKVVEVRVNGEVIAFPMKVGDAGEAFFVLETDDYVPDEFATSPIVGPRDETDLAPVDYFDLNAQQEQQTQLQQHGQGDEDGLLDNGYVSAASGHGSAFEESLKDDSDHESVFSTTGRVKDDPIQDMPGSFVQSHGSLQEPESPVPSSPSKPSPQPNPNQIPDGSENETLPAPATPAAAKRDSIDFPVDAIFPVVDHKESPSGDRDNASAQDLKSSRRGSVMFDMTGYKTDTCSESSDEDDLPRGILSDSERHHPRLRKKFGRNKSSLSTEQRQQLIEDIRQGAFLASEENLANIQITRHASRSNRRKKRTGLPTAWQGQKGRKRANSLPSVGTQDEDLSAISRDVERLADIQPKKAAVTTENMPKREPRPSFLSDTEMDYETRPAPTSVQGKGWSWGWGGLPVKQTNPDEDDEPKDDTEPKSPEVPDEIESKEFQMGSVTCRVAISLCGEEDFGKDLIASHKAFNNAQLTFEAFSKDPAAVLADKKLVCYLDGRFYTWNNAVPQLASLLFFHQPLSDAVSQGVKDQKNLAEQDRPSSTRFGTISRWFRKTPAGSSTTPSAPDSAATSSVAAPSAESGAVAIGSDDDEILPMNKAMRSKSLPPIDIGNNHTHNHTATPALSEKPTDESEKKRRYAKTLRLSSEQLQSLNLKKGANTVSFSVSSAYQGTATCVAKIFLWDYDSRVVISDIDGTITKSDALGHIFAMAGRDWTHLGVAKLFTDIRSNGYHILYLTSRAIGQADYTRKYLQKVEQNSYQLPDGPVIMSPDRLFSAFHREVIIRKPEVFKMACLRDIKKLFDDRDPFYAGFGNRITDALSYRAVNVPSSRIFTIDSNGELKLELLSAFKSSYVALTDLVNEIFPGQRVAPEFNDWNYWKADLPKIDLPDLPLAADNYTSSSSTLLSSTAKRVASFTHSSSSTSLVQPSSPTSPAVDTKSKRTLLAPQENWTSDDEPQEQDNATRGQGSKEDRKVRATSPSMLSALVPTRLIRAVRSSGSTGGQNTSATTQTSQSPEMSPALLASDDAIRPVSPPPEGLGHADENVAKTSNKSVITVGALPVEEEQEDEETAMKRLSQQGVDNTVQEDEEDYGGEEEYQGDYEGENEGEAYSDEDDEFLDQMEEDLEEPFL
ncbi:hypothetical protein BGZ79_010739 [Entomortierella chlamydospora]|nr:hypothetical protein BGZ79_010739 [Entomortierella chlamydospora]